MHLNERPAGFESRLAKRGLGIAVIAMLMTACTDPPSASVAEVPRVMEPTTTLLDEREDTATAADQAQQSSLPDVTSTTATNSDQLPSEAEPKATPDDNPTLVGEPHLEDAESGEPSTYGRCAAIVEAQLDYIGNFWDQFLADQTARHEANVVDLISYFDSANNDEERRYWQALLFDEQQQWNAALSRIEYDRHYEEQEIRAWGLKNAYSNTCKQ